MQAAGGATGRIAWLLRGTVIENMVFDPDTLELLDGGTHANAGAVLSGAMWVYNRAGERAAARLIDNLLLGFELD